MSNDPWAGRFPPFEPRTFDHRICELPVGRDLYEVTIRVTYTEEYVWSVEIVRFDPSYDLVEAPASAVQIEAALDRCTPEQGRIQEAVFADIRDRAEEAAEERYDRREFGRAA